MFMNEQLTVALLQADLAWEQIDTNLSMFGTMMDQLPGEVDLVVMPETFSTGFTMDSGRFAGRWRETLAWMQSAAKKGGFIVTGSVIAEEDGKYFNRQFWVEPGGGVTRYDKRHLFRMGREDRNFSPGHERVIVNAGGFRILLQICYDLRFPVFARNRNDYDMIIYIANWPSVRQDVYDVLLRARAIENSAFVVACNRTGTDGEGVASSGSSCIIDPRGKGFRNLGEQPGVLIETIHLDEVNRYRKSFPVQQDADNFKLLI